MTRNNDNNKSNYDKQFYLHKDGVFGAICKVCASNHKFLAWILASTEI